ncbi:MAG: hypothetical protein JWN78_39 [Bacteroidota bacterium]|nr:hypothetical protein [Bacteroidota bacterium]
MRLKINYILLLVFIAIQAKNNFAQQGLIAIQQIDTVSITDHPVNRQTNSSTFSITPLQKRFSSQNDLADLLQSTTPVQINSYGPGNIASISIRGGNDDHTNVYWNGLKINSAPLGGTDVSLIPIESGEEITIHTNTSSLGGDITINSKPDWNKKFSLHVRSDIGSFETYRNNVGFTAGNKKVQFQSNTFSLIAKNNFLYTDNYKFNHPTDTANHNEIKNEGTVNSIFIQLKDQVMISIGSWLQLKQKNIPSIMGSYEASNKFQKDATIRHFINVDKYGEKISYHISLAHSYDVLKYTDKKRPTDTVLLINSGYNTHRLSNTFYVENTFAHRLKLTTGYTYNLLIADVKEYAGKVIDHVGEASSNISIKQGDLQGSLRIAQPFSSFKYIRPQFYVDAGYMLTNKKYTVLFSYSDKYRYPDQNDRYWSPGGNPYLKPETGWTVNLGNTIDVFPDHPKHHLNAVVNIYYSKIKNNIVWTPITNIIWSPKNLKSTRLYGIESQLAYSYAAKNLVFSVNEIYNFNRVQIIQDENNADLKGHYLRYKPQHTFKSNMYVEIYSLGLGINYQYISRRFTDEENFAYFALKSYHLLDMFLTFKADIKEHHLQFIFKINNVTNTAYESIRSYAQPKRYYTFSFIYNFSKLQNNSL